MTETVRCTQCILPQGYPGVTFNEDGVCSHCQDYHSPTVLGEEKLWEAIAQRPGRQYDVLVPASGGRDSTFVMYYAVKQYGKRVFAVHFDNEFEVDQVKQNFIAAVEHLGIDYAIVRSKHGYPTKMVRHAAKAALPFSLFDIATNSCVACTYGIRGATYREAVTRGIPTVLWGDSQQEAISFPYRSNRAKYLFSPRFYHYLLFIVYTLLFQIELWIPKSRFFHFSAPTYPGEEVQDLHFFDYVAWDRRQIKETIMQEVGWNAPPEGVSSWRFGCTILPVVNYCFKQTFGFTRNFDGFANMVRDGKMEKEEALKQEAATGLMDEELVRTLRDEFKLSERDLSEYFGVTT